MGKIWSNKHQSHRTNIDPVRSAPEATDALHGLQAAALVWVVHIAEVVKRTLPSGKLT